MTVRGIADMKAAFAALGVDFEKKALPKIMRRVALKGVVVAKSKAPVDEGILRDSIKTRRLSKRKAREEGLTVGYVVAPMSKGGEPERQNPPGNKPAKPASVYGVFKEFGTERMPPAPFMRPMADEMRNEIQGGTIQEMGEELDRAIRRHARLNQ